MPGLEIHTLDHIDIEARSELFEGVYCGDLDLELDELLLDRARDTAAGLIPALQTEKAPEYPGAFSLGDMAIYSVLGNRLDDVLSMIEKKDRLAMYPVALGALASTSTISMKTGCWSIVGAWRDEKGYAFTWKPEIYGYQVDRSGNFKGISAHRMAYNMKRRATGLPDLTRAQQLDHKCRWPGCCNIDHLEIVDNAKNNKLRDKARAFEAAVTSGQIILGPTGMEWLDGPLEASDTEETNLLISTPAGPFRVIKVDDAPLMFRGEAEPGGLHDMVNPPAPKKYERPSRAKPIRVDAEQKLLFDASNYSGRRARKADLYKKWQKQDIF